VQPGQQFWSGWVIVLQPCEINHVLELTSRTSCCCIPIMHLVTKAWGIDLCGAPAVVLVGNKLWPAILRTSCFVPFSLPGLFSFKPVHSASAFCALTLLVGHQEEHLACKKWVTRCWHGYMFRARSKCFAYGPADATATLSSLASLKCRLVKAFWCGLTQVVLEKRPLNGCLSRILQLPDNNEKILKSAFVVWMRVIPCHITSPVLCCYTWCHLRLWHSHISAEKGR